MKKVLHSMLLLSLVGSASAAGISEEEIRRFALGNETDVNKLMQSINPKDVEKAAEDLMYDTATNAAQILIFDIIKLLNQKQQYLKIGASKESPDKSATKHSEAVDVTIAAMQRDVRKLEESNGNITEDELETEAAKRALKE